MAKGKQTCKILKEIRKQIAEENDIELVISECTYKGDCLGTCPKCESEVRYLERELEKRQRLGKAAVVAGLSVGLLSSSQVAFAQQTDSLDVKPVKPNHPENMLMGKPPITLYHVEPVEEVMELLVNPDSINLRVVGFDLEYIKGKRAPYSDPFPKELKSKTKHFYAPQYSGGESALLEYLFLKLDNNADGFVGDIEVSFTVENSGRLSNVGIVKGINDMLDGQVVELFKSMEWEPGLWEMKSGSKMPVVCQCVQKIHFPLDFVPMLLEGEPPVPFEEN